MPAERIETMTAVAIASAIEQGKLTCEFVMHDCLARIADREPVVRAWATLDTARAIEHARQLDRAPRRGLLHGLPVGIKDIVATVDLPTGYGSPIYDGYRAPADATCVSMLRAAGAVLPGKTVTTEFAYYQPGPTTNPHDPAHTPGGSSSGSAAAVAASMIPLAVGTQTGGSVIRPAAFCGVVGFKPTFNRLNLAGVKALSPSLDTLGCMARHVEDIELLRCALSGDAYRSLTRAPLRRIGIYRGVEWANAEPASQQAVLDAADVMREFADVDDIETIDDGASETQQTVMAFEMAQSLAFEFHRHRDALSGKLLELIERGLRVSYDEYVRAQARAQAARAAMDALFETRDALVTPSAPGEAPRGLEGTGDPIFNRRWTLLGLPAVTLPTHEGPHGLPIGVQLIGPRDGDRALLGFAREVEARTRGAT